jgi:pimeloyl-ACP methyl ester carboxylesterase
MLYEAVYPGLWLLARLRQFRARAMIALGFGQTVTLLADGSPETHFRVISWKLRKFEIEAVARLSPRLAADLALARFEITKRSKPRKRALDHMAQMRLTTVWCGKGRVDIRSCGPLDGPRLLLIHGWNATGAGLAPLIDAMAGAGYQVFVPDLPGHGSSHGDRFAFQQLGAAVVECCNPFAPFAAVVGHSAGGLIAAIAMDRGLQASRLVTLSAPSSLDGLLQTYLAANQLPMHLLPAIRDRYRFRFGAAPADIGRPLFARLRCPVLAVQDKRDWMIARANAEEIAGGARNGESFFTDGYSHLAILRASEFHNRLLRFLNDSGQEKRDADA